MKKATETERFRENLSMGTKAGRQQRIIARERERAIIAAPTGPHYPHYPHYSFVVTARDVVGDVVVVIVVVVVSVVVGQQLHREQLHCESTN